MAQPGNALPVPNSPFMECVDLKVANDVPVSFIYD